MALKSPLMLKSATSVPSFNLTVAPRPGFGGDLAYWFANKWLSYDNYVGAAAQYTAVDLARGQAVTLSGDALACVRMPDTPGASYLVVAQHVATQQTPPVIDARDVLEHPSALLRTLCDRLGVDFSDREGGRWRVEGGFDGISRRLPCRPTSTVHRRRDVRRRAPPHHGP